MAAAELYLPHLSAFDPPVAGEGSLDPMGLGAISDRLADQLVPGVRARMNRVRFVTSTAVGALAWEGLEDIPAADGISTPSICFEWVLVEAFVRRLPATTGLGIPGTMKARAVLHRTDGQRLSAATYLKGPAVFGFNGVYKPFSVDARVVDTSLLPAERCAELVRRWERDQALDGYADGVPGSLGGRLRQVITAAIRDSLLEGRCAVTPRSGLFGQLANLLHPDAPGPEERRYLRSLLLDDAHPVRAELAGLLEEVDPDVSEAVMLHLVRPRSSEALGRTIDVVVTYEELAQHLNGLFEALRFQSYAHGAVPLTPKLAAQHPLVARCARVLPSLFERAAQRISDLGLQVGFEERLGQFAIPRPAEELVEVALAHHEEVQASKLPHGKRPWFEPYLGGRVVRPGFGTDVPPTIGDAYVHPVRVGTLRRFLLDTA